MYQNMVNSSRAFNCNNIVKWAIVCLVSQPLNECEAEVDLVLIQTSFPAFSNGNYALKS